MEEGKLKQLVLSMTQVLMASDKKNEEYIAFLKKHNLPNSGPTLELLASLNQEQRKELQKIII